MQFSADICNFRCLRTMSYQRFFSHWFVDFTQINHSWQNSKIAVCRSNQSDRSYPRTCLLYIMWIKSVIHPALAGNTLGLLICRVEINTSTNATWIIMHYLTRCLSKSSVSQISDEFCCINNLLQFSLLKFEMQKRIVHVFSLNQLGYEIL